MTWDPSVFKQAFAAAGMWVPAVVTIGSSVFDDVNVGFNEPQTIVVEGGILNTGYLIEYETRDLPGLALGSAVVLGARTFKVSQKPQLKGDGFFSLAELEFVS